MNPSIRLVAFAAPVAFAAMGTLPIFSDFNSDTPGSPPATGGLNQPDSFVVPSGGSVLVQSSAVGITSQPVELMDDDGEYVTVNWSFPAVTNDVVRVEDDYKR